MTATRVSTLNATEWSDIKDEPTIVVITGRPVDTVLFPGDDLTTALKLVTNHAKAGADAEKFTASDVVSFKSLAEEISGLTSKPYKVILLCGYSQAGENAFNGLAWGSEIFCPTKRGQPARPESFPPLIEKLGTELSQEGDVDLEIFAKTHCSNGQTKTPRVCRVPPRDG